MIVKAMIGAEVIILAAVSADAEGNDAAPDRLHQTKSCVSCNLTKAYLRTARLTDTDLSGTTLKGADLTSATLTEANLDTTNLNRTSLIGTSRDHTVLDGAVFTQTSLHGADLSLSRGLVQSQLDTVCGDVTTRGPVGLKVHICDDLSE
jgi:uncharacterized protein YjbI with pentapeptide repeats